jgi:hypothetical protein
MRCRLLIPAFAALAASGCSLNVPPPSQTSSENPIDLAKQMSASIDGVAWFAQVVVVERNSSTGNIRFTGVLNFGQVTERSIILQFKSGISGQQTLSAGDAYAQVGVGNSTLQTWSTKSGGPVGTINVTIVSPTRLTGTFAFDASGNVNDLTPAVRRVTSGVFDVTF